MPRRWSTETRAWAYRYLVLRDGEFCQICHRSPTTFNGLDIDHIDGNKHHNEESNLRLLCRTHNVSLENVRRSTNPSVQREREIPRTRVIKQAVSYRDGSPEMQANYLYEIDYRKWLIDYLQEHGFLPKKEAINAGAEVVGCNPTTSAKYLAKLTSLFGPLLQSKDMLGDDVIVLKNGTNGKKPTLK